MALIAVISIAVGGKVFLGPVSATASAPSVPVVAAMAAEADVAPSGRAATPSPRSDWPAAIGGKATPTPVLLRRPREEGTDGLMGRIVFGLPNDTPYPTDQTDAPTMTDERAEWSLDHAGLDTTPPWVRRLQGLSNYRTDPYMR